jgi:hypothetical protein
MESKDESIGIGLNKDNDYWVSTAIILRSTQLPAAICTGMA